MDLFQSRQESYCFLLLVSSVRNSDQLPQIYNLVFWQFAFSVITSLLVLIFIRNDKVNEREADGKLIVWSAILGTLNFIGTFEIVKALSAGPFSLVYTINSFYILVSSVVAWKLFGEKLTKQKFIFILLAIGVIILIKLG